MNYFLYDLKQLWRNNGRAVILLGFLSVFTYLVWVIGSLVFTREWHAPTLVARAIFFYVGMFILVLYSTRTYGYLTEKKAGSSWLMIPASATQKFVSMMVISIVVLPLAYICSYLLLDGVICLLDPSAGDSLITGLGPLLSSIGEFTTEADIAGFDINLGLLAVPFILQLISNFLFFLLCGICFKKWKLVGAFAILLVISMVITPITSGLAIHYWAPYIEYISVEDDPERLVSLVNTIINIGTAINTVLVLGLGAGIYYRIKTLKH
ncbi:MAG: hypothetical protein J5669_08005 [Bacteroidales bacterium]|nr:hypothetical protein [Bacteroidales bacterium]